MGRNRAPLPTFELGDFIFAKMRGYRPWPARVLGRFGSVSNTKYNVLFYGTWDTAKVSPSHMFDFERNKRRLGALPCRRTARNTDFRRAMTYARRALEWPANDFVYYQVLARTEGDGECCVAYEASTTESEVVSNEEHTGDSTAASEILQSKAEEQEKQDNVETKPPRLEKQLGNSKEEEYDDPESDFIVESSEDLDSDKDQPINLCCRHVSRAEQ